VGEREDREEEGEEEQEEWGKGWEAADRWQVW
jgi:hypothetical protein